MKARRRVRAHDGRALRASPAKGGGGDAADASAHAARLVNLNEDPSLSGVLVFALRDDAANLVGKRGAATDEPALDVVLGGLGIAADHALVHVEGGDGGGGGAAPPRAPLSRRARAATPFNAPRAAGHAARRDRDRVVGQRHDQRVSRRAARRGRGAEPPPDWEFAMKEVNAAPSPRRGRRHAAERGRRRAPRARAELDARVAALESELAASARARGRAAASAAGEVSRSRRNSRRRSPRWAARRAARAEAAERGADDALRLLPLVHEANSIAAELGRASRRAARDRGPGRRARARARRGAGGGRGRWARAAPTRARAPTTRRPTRSTARCAPRSRSSSRPSRQRARRARPRRRRRRTTTTRW